MKARYARLLAAVGTIGVAAAAWAIAAQPQAPTGATAKQCIVPAEDIRRTHPDRLKHQRDRTMREGVRGEAASLNACIACHAASSNQGVTEALTARLEKAGARIDPTHFAPDQGPQFCQTCHRYAAVKLDCFECHARAPAAQASFGGIKP